MRALRRSILILSLSIGILVFGSFLTGNLIFSESFSVKNLLLATQLLFVAMTPCYIIPNFLFQIDATRPWIQAALVVLLSAFICTAIYASLLAAVILPFFDYYGKQSQEGRFYRA